MSFLGMYHCIQPENNHKKYYHVLWDNNEKNFLCKWGRIGSTPQVKRYEKSHAEMAVFMRSKIRKGYKPVAGYEEEIGQRNNAHDYIMSLDTGLE